MKYEDIYKEALENYREATDYWQGVYKASEDDIKFVYDIDDGQWDLNVLIKRKSAGRPIITINKCLKFIRQLRSEQTLNRFSIKVIPVDSEGDPEKAEIYKGLIRGIEYLSNADISYGTAYMHAVAGGIGYFRIVTEYVGDSFDQEIFIRRILTPSSVHYGPGVKFNLEDSEYCFIEEDYDKKRFSRVHPKAKAIGFSGDEIDNDKIKVAEYFWKDYTKTKKVQLRSGEELYIENGVTEKLITDMGGEIVRERMVEKCHINWCKMNGVEILDEVTIWPGEYIPVVPVFGDEVISDGKRYYLSLIRGAKGIQQMYNYWASSATENVALSPKMPFIVDHRQIKGFENEWNDANIENRMYIRYNAISGLAKPSREPQSNIPAAIISMMQAMAYDIEDHLGRYEASKGQTSNERSGKAILARAAQSEKGSFTYIDNFQRAIIYAGKQLIDLIPKIYDTPRALRIIGDTDEHDIVNINVPYIDSEGNVSVLNDLSVGRYDLIATVGASYASKRQEMVAMMLEAMQYAPTLAPLIAPLVFKYSDWPGAEEIYNEIKKEVEQQKLLATQQPQRSK